MANTSIQEIIDRLNDHERRLRLLEAINKGEGSIVKPGAKPPTLPEIIKGKKFKSGQEKVAIIVGYYEKILKAESIKTPELKEGWKIGKFNGQYKTNLLTRALKDGLVRDIGGNLDLSQTGEEFWDSFTK